MLNRFLGYVLVSFCSFACGADRPNFVWIVSEDNSIHYLKHFFPRGAETPNIERLAAEGLTYDHAFSNAPVCSVARTTLITGCYGPRIGTQFHRRYQLAPMPEGLRMFPAYLRGLATIRAIIVEDTMPSKEKVSGMNPRQRRVGETEQRRINLSSISNPMLSRMKALFISIGIPMRMNRLRRTPIRLTWPITIRTPLYFDILMRAITIE